LRQALTKAKPGRAFILSHMYPYWQSRVRRFSPYAPRIEKIKINPEKIGAVIGKGGEMINKITSETGAQIDIKDDGLITVAAADTSKIEKAINWIKSLTEEPEVGRVYEGKVVSIKDFGAFINICQGLTAWFISRSFQTSALEKVEDVLKEGQIVKAKLVGIDERGRLSLSLKDVE